MTLAVVAVRAALALGFGVMLAGAAAAQGASTVIASLQLLSLEEQYVTRSQLCTSRFAPSATPWAEALAGFRARNSGPLEELRQLRRELLQAEAICERWREALAAGGEVEQRLPAALEGARRLRPPAAAGSAPAR